MRTKLLVSAMLLSCATTSFALALETTDSMRAWAGASDKDRADLLRGILGKDDAANARITRCLNETAAAPGHADLPIGEVAKVCASPANAGQPV